MSIKQTTKSSYAGFLDGYIAGNLSANSKELSFHTDQIFIFIKDLHNDLKKWNLDNETEKILNEAFVKIESLDNDNTVDLYFPLGDILLNIYTVLSNQKELLPTTAKYHLNKIIYHYLNIARTLKDTKVTRKAKAIVDKFEKE
jgi:hypothetical protein